MENVDNFKSVEEFSDALNGIYDLGPRRIYVRLDPQKKSSAQKRGRLCKRCGKEFTARKGFKKFCSRSCRDGIFFKKKEAPKKILPVRSRPDLIQQKNFYFSREWLALRYRALAKYGRECMCCGAMAKPPHVDHIKPRSKYPELELDFNNLQILCHDCNMGKGNLDETDWRAK